MFNACYEKIHSGTELHKHHRPHVQENSQSCRTIRSSNPPCPLRSRTYNIFSDRPLQWVWSPAYSFLSAASKTFQFFALGRPLVGCNNSPCHRYTSEDMFNSFRGFDSKPAAATRSQCSPAVHRQYLTNIVSQLSTGPYS